MSPFRALPLLCLFLALSGGGCSGKGKPRFALQQVMFQVESELRKTQTEVDAGNLAGVQQHAGELRRWWNDQAHELYISSGKIAKDKEGFLKVRGDLSAAIDRVEEAARGGDLAKVKAENATLRSTCDRCHIAYRPLVTKRYGQ